MGEPQKGASEISENILWGIKDRIEPLESFADQATDLVWFLVIMGGKKIVVCSQHREVARDISIAFSTQLSREFDSLDSFHCTGTSATFQDRAGTSREVMYVLDLEKAVSHEPDVLLFVDFHSADPDVKACIAQCRKKRVLRGIRFLNSDFTPGQGQLTKSASKR